LTSHKGSDNDTTYVMTARQLFRVFLEKFKGEHHDMALMSLLSLVKAPLRCPTDEETATLNGQALALREAARPGFTKVNGVASPSFRVWTSKKYFAGQNVTWGATPASAPATWRRAWE
jgi:hypothetical protein